jgi:hypothetical protein
MALFRSFWHGKPLSPYQQLCLKSFVDCGHEFILYSYDRVDVPAGIELEDAAAFFPRDRVFFYSSGPGAGSVSAFSNLFRYRLLHEEGGWWTDADVICLSRDVPEEDIVFGWQDRSRALIGSAILKFPREHHLVAALYKTAQQMGAQVAWGQAGPDLVTQLVKQHALDHLARDASLIYPLEPGEAIHALMPAHRDAIREKTGGALFLHLWNEILRRASVLDAVAPPHGSFLSELFEKHGIKFRSNLVYSDDQVQRLHDNFAGYLQSTGTDAEIAAHRFEITYLKGELDKARKETQSALADRDLHRQFMQKLSSSWLWRMSWPLRAIARLYRNARSRPRQQG